MQDELKRFFSEIQDSFLAGRLRDVTRCLSKPLVVYSVTGVVVLQDEAEIAARVAMYRDALLALSTKIGTFELVSEDPVINDRLRVTLRTTYLDANNDEVTSSLSRYFLARSKGSFVVEMIEYLEVPVPLDEADSLH